MPTISGVSFWGEFLGGGGGLKLWRNKGENFDQKIAVKVP